MRDIDVVAPALVEIVERYVARYVTCRRLLDDARAMISQMNEDVVSPSEQHQQHALQDQSYRPDVVLVEVDTADEHQVGDQVAGYGAGATSDEEWSNRVHTRSQVFNDRAR